MTTVCRNKGSLRKHPAGPLQQALDQYRHQHRMTHTQLAQAAGIDGSALRRLLTEPEITDRRADSILTRLGRPDLYHQLYGDGPECQAAR